MLEELGRFTISAQQHKGFSALSGDFNPFHVDEIYSRKLQFGQPCNTWHSSFITVRGLGFICLNFSQSAVDRA